jgi:hypothetical protein
MFAVGIGRFGQGNILNSGGRSAALLLHNNHMTGAKSTAAALDPMNNGYPVEKGGIGLQGSTTGTAVPTERQVQGAGVKPAKAWRLRTTMRDRIPEATLGVGLRSRKADP